MNTTRTLNHQLNFSYDQPTKLDRLVLTIAPLAMHADLLVSQSLSVDPQPAVLTWVELGDGRRAAQLSFKEPVKAWSLTNKLQLRPTKPAIANAQIDASAQNFPFQYGSALTDQLRAYTVLPHADTDLVEILKILPNQSMPTFDALNLVNEEVQNVLDDRLPIETSPAQEAEEHARLLVKVLRAIRIAARFARGYDLDAKGQLICWAQAFIPGCGWLNLNADSTVQEAELIALSSGTSLTQVSLSELSEADSHISLETIPLQLSLPKTEQNGLKPTSVTKSEGMAKAADKIDRLLKTAKLDVKSFIQIQPDEQPSEQTGAAWPDIVQDLNTRLDQQSTTAVPPKGRLHNLHQVEGKKAVDTVQRARFLTLAFPSLTRLVGMERFDGPYLKAADEALQIGTNAPAQIFKARHDLTAPFQTLPNALLERAILARLAKTNGRFAPRSTVLLNDNYRLPTLLNRDLKELCSWLSADDLQIDANWFAANLEQRYPLLQTIDLLSSSRIEIRPAFKSTTEKHQFSLLEFNLIGDDADRFEIAVDGWLLPLQRVATGKVAAVKSSDFFAELHISVYEKWERKRLVQSSLKISNGNKVTLTEQPKDQRRLLGPPPHPDLNTILDLAWAKHWGGTGHRF